MVRPHATSYLRVNVEMTTVTRQRAITDMFGAWRDEFITIFMSHCHFLSFYLFFVGLFGLGFFTHPWFPFVFDLSHFLSIAQARKEQIRVLNGKELFSRSLQISNETKKEYYKYFLQCPKSRSCV